MLALSDKFYVASYHDNEPSLTYCLPNGFGMSLILMITMSPPAGTLTAESLLQSSTIRFSVPSALLSCIKLMVTHCRSPGLLPAGKVTIAGEGPLKSRPSERSEISGMLFF